MKPFIGITATLKEIEYYERQVNCHLLPAFYTRAVSGAGGAPLLIPPGEDAVNHYLDVLNGIIISGEAESPARDNFEILLLRGALQRDIPVLAICRGTLLLNVTLGGTLLQGIKEQCGKKIKHWPETAELTHEII